jgi:hypothetical protein
VDIYSAYPYNGYRLGSGTSMAAPMVAGEAALLMSRYPDWTPAQVIERIVGKVDPVPGATVGRIDLADAITTSPRIDYAITDVGVPMDNHIKPRIRIVNNTPETIPVSQLTIRYWYTIDSDQAQTFHCDYSSVGCGAITGTFVRIPDGSPNRTAVADSYLEVGFPGNGSSLLGGGWAELGLRFNKNDWSNYNETNDYSYDPAKTVPTQWSRVTLYRNGILIWGVEPGTVQPAPPGNTPTPTVTSSPTVTLSLGRQRKR